MQIRLVLILLFLFMPLLSQAELTIEISGGGAQQIPIAVVPFGQAAKPNQENLSNIINADLRRSGMFRVLETRGVANQPTDTSQIKFPEWAGLQAQALAVGSVQPITGNRLKVTFALVDVLKQNQLAGMEYTISPNQLRLTAHKIADVIYQKLTGESGIFASRIAFRAIHSRV